MFDLIIVVLFIITIVAVKAWIKNPNNQWNINSNVESVLRQKMGGKVIIEHASEELEQRYRWLLKDRYCIRCVRDPRNSPHLVLVRIA